MAIQFQDSIQVNNGSLVATNFIAVKGNSNSDISEYNQPNSTSVNLGTYLNQYSFIDLSSSASGGSWIDFSKADGTDYSGRIRYENNTDEFQIFTSGRLTATIESNGNATGSWGHAKIYTSNRWGNGGNYYPTIGSEDGGAGSLIMLDNPHVPWSTENPGHSSYDGRAGLRLERPDKASWWDVGLAGDFFHIYRNGSGELFRVSANGSIGIGRVASVNESLSINSEDGFWTLATYQGGNLIGGIHTNSERFTIRDNRGESILLDNPVEISGSLTVNGSISATGYNSVNWNTAYGWGNHAGLYDAIGSADAVNIRIDEEVIPLIDTKADASHEHQYIRTVLSTQEADDAMPSTGYALQHFLGKGPSNNDGHILGMTWTGTSVYGAQIWVDTDPNNLMAFRSRSNAGVWTRWNNLWHDGNLINVSQLTNDSGYINGDSIARFSYGTTDSTYSRFTHVRGGVSLNNPSGTGGAIRINLPVQNYNTNTMMSMTIKVYEYITGKSFTLFCGGYNYNNGVWYNTFAILLGDNQRGDVPVKFGQDGTRNVIWIGNPDWGWSYPNVFITDFQSGHTQNANWNDEWEIVFDEEPAVNVTAQETAHQQINTGNIGNYGYLTSYTETDTLASVAGRGNVSTTAIAIEDSDLSDHWPFRVNTNGSNNSGFWTTDEDIRLLLRNNSGSIKVDLRPDGTSYFYNALQASSTFVASSTATFNGVVNLNSGVNFDGVNGQNFTVNTDGDRIIWDFQRNGTRRMSFYHEANQETFNFAFQSGSNLQINGNRILTTADSSSYDAAGAADAVNLRIEEEVLPLIDTKADASHTHDYLPLAGGTLTGALTINHNGDAINLRSTTNSQPSRITFSSDVPADQVGYIEYSHVNTASYGSGESFVIGGNQANITILADGKLMYNEGIYSKPASGTGAGTRKDANWDTAYGWGNHASAGYLTIGQEVPSQASWGNSTRFYSEGDIAFSGAGNHSLQVVAENGNDAFMAFHIHGDHAVYFGLENSTNRLYTGGWSLNSAKYQIWDSRDFNPTDFASTESVAAVNERIDTEVFDAISTAQATADAALPKTGGIITGQVIFPSAATTKPVLPNGFISRNDNNDTTGRHDIWGISERYYPSNSTAGDAWGIQWSGTPNDIVFVGGGEDKFTISLDEGNIASGGTVRSQNTTSLYAQLESNASGGVVKGSGGGGFLIRSYGDAYFNGGKVGIGTSSPAQKLHVEGGAIRATGGTSNGKHADIYVNDSWAYFTTNVGKYYLNAEVRVDGGKIGSYNEDLQLATSGTTKVIVADGLGHMFPVNDRTQWLGREQNRWQIVFCEILDSAGQHEKNLQNPEGEKSVGEYETGTVLVWKGGKNVPCTEAADHMRMGIAVKGIASPLIQGAEPVLVTGEVNEGDYLVTSRKEGHAEAITPQFMRQHGLYDCVIGKALESGKGKSHLIKTWISI